MPRFAEIKTSGHRKIMIVTAISALTLGCSLLVAGLAIPPPGEIHNSVLVAFGEISTFSGTLLGMSGIKKKKQ